MHSADPFKLVLILQKEELLSPNCFSSILENCPFLLISLSPSESVILKVLNQSIFPPTLSLKNYICAGWWRRTYTINPSTWKVEAGGYLSSKPAWSIEWVPGQQKQSWVWGWHTNLIQAIEGRARHISGNLRQPDLHSKFQTNQSLYHLKK